MISGSNLAFLSTNPKTRGKNVNFQIIAPELNFLTELTLYQPMESAAKGVWYYFSLKRGINEPLFIQEFSQEKLIILLIGLLHSQDIGRWRGFIFLDFFGFDSLTVETKLFP